MAEAESPSMAMKLCVYGIAKKFSSIRNLTTSILASKLKLESEHTTETPAQDKVLILDSRPVEEYNISHIPGAVRVDYEAQADSLASALPQLNHSGLKTVVCYCSVGYRSCMVAEKLNQVFQQQGTQDKIEVYNLEGGLFKWANENRPLVDYKGQTTVSAHPYNSVFGKLLKAELRKTEID